MPVGASGTVLGRGLVAQCRVAVPMVVVVFEVGDDYTGLEQRRPAVAVEAFVAQPVVERLDKPGLVAIALITVGCSDSEDTASSASSSSPTPAPTTIATPPPPARLARTARRIILHLPDAWPWQTAFDRLFTATHAPPPPAAAS